MFAFYSSKLKSVLHYNQVQVNNLGVAKDLGENVGLLAGYLCNKVPPWALLSIGAAAGFLGYGVTWLVVSEHIGALPYWQVKQASIISPPPIVYFLLHPVLNFVSGKAEVLLLLLSMFLGSDLGFPRGMSSCSFNILELTKHVVVFFLLSALLNCQS